MKIIRNERVVPCDIDGTLVVHIKEKDNVCTLELVSVYDPLEGAHILLRKNLPMIRILKEEHARGAYVVVWSRGGFEWASNVIEALELQDYVDLIISKPHIYLDDVEIKDWLKDRVYLDPDTTYKTITKGVINGI